MIKRKKTDFVQFKVRLREQLRARLEASAKAGERSLNSEIVSRLEESFAQDRYRRTEEEIKRLAEMIAGVTLEQQAFDAKWEARLINDPRIAKQVGELDEAISEHMDRSRQQEGKK
jgi:hypothetical protein